MESTSSSSHKRHLDGLTSSNPPPTEKRVRFPKGKKSRRGGERLPVWGGKDGDDDGEGGALPLWGDANVAATERAKRRNRMIEEEVLGKEQQQQPHHAGSTFEENTNFDDSGVPLDPFNLDHEREEGYFDESGNYVEYVRNNEIKDAWLDGIDAEAKFVELKTSTTAEREEEDYKDLSAAEVGRMKRSIANVLMPGETVMEALRRLKGKSCDKKQKMTGDAKRLFEELTENAMKLMDNGEYNVYHEERETFEREAEGYERLARAKEGSLNDNHESEHKQLAFSESGSYSSVLETEFLPSKTNDAHALPSDPGGEFDMFGDDDENEEKASANPNLNPKFEESKSSSENDYVFDDSTGYYYSSSLGYYYDPRSGLYCSAMTGKWYSYNEQTSSYNEVESQDASLSYAPAHVTD